MILYMFINSLYIQLSKLSKCYLVNQRSHILHCVTIIEITQYHTVLIFWDMAVAMSPLERQNHMVVTRLAIGSTILSYDHAANIAIIRHRAQDSTIANP